MEEVTGKGLQNALALAELIAAPYSVKFRYSCYAGIELYWIEENIMRIVTLVDTFAYTKNPANLLGNWQKTDYWFLYLK